MQTLTVDSPRVGQQGDLPGATATHLAGDFNEIAEVEQELAATDTFAIDEDLHITGPVTHDGEQDSAEIADP